MSAESFGGFATLVKLYGFKAALGMVGAAMLYIVLPPLNADGTFNKGEFVARLACAALKPYSLTRVAKPPNDSAEIGRAHV